MIATVHGLDWAGIGAALAGGAAAINAVVNLFQHLHLKKHDKQLNKLARQTSGEPFTKDNKAE